MEPGEAGSILAPCNTDPMAKTATRNLGRLSEIAQVAVKHGFGYFGSTLPEDANPADQADAYALLAVPTLVLSVRDDPLMPSQLAVMAAAPIPGATLVNVEGDGHLFGPRRPRFQNGDRRVRLRGDLNRRHGPAQGPVVDVDGQSSPATPTIRARLTARMNRYQRLK